MTLCKCGCGKEIRQGNKYIYSHHLTKSHQSNAGKLSQIKQKKKENYHELKSIIGKEVHKKYPNLAKRMLESAIKNNPNFRSEAGIKAAIHYHDKFSLKEPKKYKENMEKFQRLGREKCKKNKKGRFDSSLQSKLGKRGGSKTAEILRKKREFLWDDVIFNNEQEMIVAFYLLSKPKVGYNYQIKIKNKFIDFFPQMDDKMYIGCFVEYHPWDRSNISEEKYFDNRNEIINKSKFHDIPLIVIKNLSEIEDELNE